MKLGFSEICSILGSSSVYGQIALKLSEQFKPREKLCRMLKIAFLVDPWSKTGALQN